MNTSAAPPPSGAAWRHFWLQDLLLTISVWAAALLLASLTRSSGSAHLSTFVIVVFFVAAAANCRSGGVYTRSSTNRGGVALGSGRMRRGRVLFVVTTPLVDAAAAVLGPLTGRLPAWASALAGLLGAAHLVVLVWAVRRGRGRGRR